MRVWFLRRRTQRPRSMDRRQAPAWASTAAGAIAGAVSRFAVGPLDVLKIRFQVQLEPIAAQAVAGAAASKYTSMRQAVVTIVREEGIQVGAGLRGGVAFVWWKAERVPLFWGGGPCNHRATLHKNWRCS